MAMLILLVYVGIHLIIQTSTTDKATYKRVLFDWVVGMILVFSIHYILLFMIQFNEILVDAIAKMKENTTGLQVYEYGLLERVEKPMSNADIEIALYNEVKTRSYDPKASVGFVGMIMYGTLVYFAWKYSFIYMKIQFFF